MYGIKRIALFFSICLINSLVTIMAQPQLNRISITERSDGNGYVIRYHLTQIVASYELSQPELNRIQMQLFSSTLDAAAVDMPDTNNEITEIELIDIDGGVGVDIQTADDIYFRAETYPDQNLRDLLLNLEYTTEEELRQIASEDDPFSWSIQQPEASTETEPQSERPQTEEAIDQVQPMDADRSWDYTFGIAGGVGFANKIGGSYTSNSRQQLVMGLTVSVILPFVLPYSVEPIFETGFYYTQKGFKNPTGEAIQAQTVVLDYVEIPLLAKLRYTHYDLIKSIATGGIYTAFRTAGEIVEQDGDRENIGEVTNNVDWGLSAGIGAELVFEKATVSLQTRYSIGVPKMFKEGYSGSERPGYLKMFVVLQF